MKTDDFDYELPKEYIAQSPLEPRDSCKLLVLHKDGSLEHKIFRDIIYYLHKGDLLIVNETRVLPARIYGEKPTGAKVEMLLLDECKTSTYKDSSVVWNCLVKPGKRLKEGAKVLFYDKDYVCVLEAGIEGINEDNGSRVVRFNTDRASFYDVLHKIGHTPLPPYIREYTGDEELYQTVYSTTERSAAAPTAGLHFTEDLLENIKGKGVDIASVDLEVGLDTFRTVSVDNPKEHQMHTELYTVPQETVNSIESCKARGGRVIAVGTTSVRSLESAASSGELNATYREATNLFILPGYKFKVVDAIITNFHVPRSTLVMLISAFNKREQVLAAYEEAKRNNYRFFSFGDAMFLD